MDKLATPIFNFVRKAIVQQLPTAANLVRWGKSVDPLCPLCQNSSQSNKHVLSCCGSSVALDRYKKRHDAILKILADWITNHIKPDREIYVDLQFDQYKPLSTLPISKTRYCHPEFERNRHFGINSYCMPRDKSDQIETV